MRFTLRKRRELRSVVLPPSPSSAADDPPSQSAQTSSALATTLSEASSALSPVAPLSERLRAAHKLASVLAVAAGASGLMIRAEAQLQASSPIGALMQLSQVCEEAGNDLAVHIVLSCLANLSYCGLTQQVAAAEGVGPLLGRWLKRPDSVMFALPAAYNLSTEEVVLQSLDNPAVRLLLGELVGLKKYEKHSAGLLKNLDRYHALQQPRRASGAWWRWLTALLSCACGEEERYRPTSRTSPKQDGLVAITGGESRMVDMRTEPPQERV